MPEQIRRQTELVFAYPVQYSNIPKILNDYIEDHKELWKGKKVFVIATMGLFSGDGAGILARLLSRYGAETVGGLHVKMPDSIADEKALKRPLDVNRKLVAAATGKIRQAARDYQQGKPPQEGIGVLCHLAGLFGQRLYFYNKTKRYTDQLRIDPQSCIGCQTCVTLCPMNNISMENGIAVSSDRCTMCYRCVNRCPKQAITLLGRQVVEQCQIEKYCKRENENG